MVITYSRIIGRSRDPHLKALNPLLPPLQTPCLSPVINRDMTDSVISQCMLCSVFVVFDNHVTFWPKTSCFLSSFPALLFRRTVSGIPTALGNIPRSVSAFCPLNISLVSYFCLRFILSITLLLYFIFACSVLFITDVRCTSPKNENQLLIFMMLKN